MSDQGMLTLISKQKPGTKNRKRKHHKRSLNVRSNRHTIEYPLNRLRSLKTRFVKSPSIFPFHLTPLYSPPVAYLPSSNTPQAVVGLTKADGNAYAPHHIRVNAICPGYVKTPLFLSSLEDGSMNDEMAKTPMGRMAEVEEIGDSIAFLASPMASFMVGSSLVVDGGYTVC